MRARRIAVEVLLLLSISRLVSAQGGPAGDTASSAPSAARMFAPYVDMTETSSDLPAIQAASGIKYFTLAFIVSDHTCSPAWEGTPRLPISKETRFSTSISRVRSQGGDVVVSFGGYSGRELALACSDVAQLQAAYQAVIDKYKVAMVDFDVEGGNAASIDRRSRALKALAAANPKLQISFTLPVDPAGLTKEAMNVLQSAATIGVPVSVVNLMTMNYGKSLPRGKKLSTAAASAADSALEQIRSLGLNARLGITPMIGMNDVAGEVLTLPEARSILSYARLHPEVVRFSMWSTGRDNGNCVGKVSPACSGIAQSPWEFSHLFQEF